MKILTVDIGTGTQDIYLYNSLLDMENNLKLVIPSPTMIIHRRIKQATEHGAAILLTGVTMGGGPSAWAIETHLRAGFMVYATSDAARTLNDDLEVVKQMGVTLLGEDEAARLPSSVKRLKLFDFDLESLLNVFQTFEINMNDLAAIAVGVFDHGNAPKNISDRKFRFDYLDERIRKLNRLSAFAYRAEEVPDIMTRMKAVADSVHERDVPLVIMDTAPAAVLGATLDRKVYERQRVIIANVGNFHTLAFRLGPIGIEGLFEHHTGMLDLEKVKGLIWSLADGTLQGEDVFEDQGHGALIYQPTALILGDGDYDVAVTGPRRSIFNPEAAGMGKKSLRPYFPAPFGDMMITGCFGLLAATVDLIPELGDPIRKSLSNDGRRNFAPWDVE